MKTQINRIVRNEPVYDFNMILSAFECETICMLLNNMRDRSYLIFRTKWFDHIKRNTILNDVNILQLQNGVQDYEKNNSNVLFNIRNVVTQTEIDNIIEFFNKFNFADDIKNFCNCPDLSPITLCDIVYCVTSFKKSLNTIRDIT